MRDQSFDNLMPSDDEINKLLEKTLRENPSSYPFVVFQILLARLLLNRIGELDKELAYCWGKLKDYIHGDDRW